VHALLLECASGEKDLLIAELWERGTKGVSEEDLPTGRCGLRAFFDERFAAGTAWAPYSARWESEEDRDWVDVAQSQWQPVLVGERFFLVPAWRTDPTPAGRLRLEMQPGQSCGTGWGPATQLALLGMERCLRPGMTVLDLGTGSGILSVAAAKLKASRVYACDIDISAAQAAAERFRSEQVDAGVFAGSLHSVRSGAVNFLAANINAETLLSLAPEILRVLDTGGGAVLTGFPYRHLERVCAAFVRRGQILERGEWRALVWTGKTAP
jgi:ribosomal protein L11 methyltransferase